MLFGLVALEITDGEPTQRRAGDRRRPCCCSRSWLRDRDRDVRRGRRSSGSLIDPLAALRRRGSPCRRSRTCAWYLAFGRARCRRPCATRSRSRRAPTSPAFVVGGVRQRRGRHHRRRVRRSGSSSSHSLVVHRRPARAGHDRSRARASACSPRSPSSTPSIGLVRGDLFAGQVDYTRYTYVSGILLLLAVVRARRPICTCRQRGTLASFDDRRRHLDRRPCLRRTTCALLVDGRDAVPRARGHDARPARCGLAPADSRRRPTRPGRSCSCRRRTIARARSSMRYGAPLRTDWLATRSPSAPISAATQSGRSRGSRVR